MINGFFLQQIVYDQDIYATGLFGLLATFIVLFLIFAIGFYIYLSLAFMSLAKKAKYKSPGIAWIPLVGPSLICAKTAKMHWWPVLLLIGVWIPILGALLSITYTVFFIIWLWKTYEYVNKPGWWAILWIIPIVGWILLGVVAWSKK